MKGRKPIPTNLKIVKGTSRVCRINTHEPEPEKSDNTAAPCTLSSDAKDHWAEIAKELNNCGILTNLDKDALSVYCELYVHWLDACDMLNSKGMVIADPRHVNLKDEDGNRVVVPILSPYFTALLKISEQMKKLLCEFGMTPSSRTRVNAEKNSGDSLEELSRKQKEKRRIAREGV